MKLENLIRAKKELLEELDINEAAMRRLEKALKRAKLSEGEILQGIVAIDRKIESLENS